MIKTDRHIHDLLKDHDCVIVPDFGGFIGNYGPARIDPHAHRFSPPRKEIGFNRNLVKNDGLLAQRVATAEDTGYAEALLLIRDTVDRWESDLERHRHLHLESIGTIYLDRNNKLRFEPDLSANFLPEAFGLSAFHSLPVAKKVAAPASAPVVEEVAQEQAAKVIPIDRQPEPAATTAEQPAKRNRLRYIVYGAAAAAVLGYLTMIPVQSRFWQDTNFAYSDLNIFSEVCPEYKDRTHLPEAVERYATPNSSPEFPEDSEQEFASWALTGDEGVIAKDIVVRLKEAPKPTLKPEEALNFPFHIVGGCFGQKENAERMVDRMRDKGYAANIIDQKGGLWRVAIHSYATRSEAKIGLAQIQKDESPSSWILVR